VADDLQKVDVQALVDRADSLQLRKTLTQLSHPRAFHRAGDLPHLGAVKTYIEKSFAESGVQTYRQPFPWRYTVRQDTGRAGSPGDTTGVYQAHNIIGRIAGTGNEPNVIILGAHFDAVSFSPGADDNASGVAAMLEVMRILAGQPFVHSIRFVGFDLEEAGLQGSRMFVDAGGIRAAEKVIGCLNYDMIGFTSDRPNSQYCPPGFDQLFPDAYKATAADGFRGNFLLSTANEASGWLSRQFDSCARAYVPGFKVISLVIPGDGSMVPDLRKSDHATFWDRNLQALHLGDGANTRNPHYHGPKDEIGTLNVAHMVGVVKATVATLAATAGILHGTAVTHPLSPGKPDQAGAVSHLNR
jgi:hypothetical protein